MLFEWFCYWNIWYLDPHSYCNANQLKTKNFQNFLQNVRDKFISMAKQVLKEFYGEIKGKMHSRPSLNKLSIL